jgi:hypothetical protein
MATADTNEHIHCATRALVPTYSNTDDVPNAGLWRGILGNGAAAVTASVLLQDDPDSNPIALILQPGCILPMSVRRVRVTGTGAAPGEVILLR